MTCLYPIDAWRSKKTNPDTGKRSIVFRRDLGFSDSYLQVPCGKCLGCLQDRAKDWSIRIQNEASLHERNAFLTLTYSDLSLPKDGKLVKAHMQQFIKKLRNRKNVLRYFGCGEYGGLRHRAHYHAIIFGMDFLGPDTEPCGDNGEFVNLEVTKIWGRGAVVIAPVTPASCAYVAGYVNKKIGDKDTFQLMSNKPGIGHNWIDKYYSDVVKTGSIVGEDGQQSRVPRRYLEWQEEELLPVKQQRQQYIKDMTPERRFDLNRERRDREIHLKQLVDHRQRKEKVGK